MRKGCGIVIIGLSLLWANCWGATYYLNSLSAGGDGTTPELSGEHAAFATLATAKSTVYALGDNGGGNTVMVYEGDGMSYGTYSDSGTSPANVESRSADNWLIWKAATGENPVFTQISFDFQNGPYDTYIKFDGFTVTPAAGGRQGIMLRGTDYVQILNCNVYSNGVNYINGVSGNGYGIYVFSLSNHITISGCEISGGVNTGRFDGFDTGIKGEAARYSSITDNIVKSSRYWGISITNSNMIVTGNEINMVSGDAGIAVMGGTGTTVISNNTVHNAYLYTEAAAGYLDSTKGNKFDLTEVPTETTWSADGTVMTNANATWNIDSPYTWINNLELRVLSGNNCYTGDSSGDNDWKVTAVDVSGQEATLTKTIALLGIDFTSGGTFEPAVGDTITGQTSNATATIYQIQLDSGSWAGGDAVGTIKFYSQTGTFQAEEVKFYDKSLTTWYTDAATVSGNSSRLQVSNVDYYFIEQNHCDGIQFFGNPMSNITISCNTFYDCYGQIWWLSPGTNVNNTGWLIENNLCYGDYASGAIEATGTIGIFSCVNPVIRNNTFIGNLYMSGSGHSIYSNAISYWCGYDYETYTAEDYNWVNRGPVSVSGVHSHLENSGYAWDNWEDADFTALFTDFDNHDFTLPLGSALINAGDPVNSSTTDQRGYSAVGVRDIGYWEYGATSSIKYLFGYVQ